MKHVLQFIFLLMIFITSSSSSTIEELQWGSGQTLLGFLEEHQLPLGTYYDLDPEEKELATEVMAGVNYHLLTDEESGEFQQALIPISDEMQMMIMKNEEACSLEFLPISYQTLDSSVIVEINRSPYQDVYDATKSHALASELVSVYKNSIDFRREIRKGDKVVILYSQKYRLGKMLGQPQIHAALIETNKRTNYIFHNSDGRYYDENGKEVEGFLLNAPLKYRRISSKFTKRRWHPILKKYRPHLGVDYAANRGTPIKAAGSGKIIFAGRKGGYGKTVIIRHNDTYRTLYAHMNGYARGVRNGKWIKQGQTIGYVGNTGMSTGPHLHFGLYRNGRAINPLSKVKIKRNRLNGEKKEEFLTLASKYKESIENVIIAYNTPEGKKPSDYIAHLDNPPAPGI